ncbi:GGDEF domain-containing protein, partial [Bathymodiolus platifrons methanotrophic gill symbiont]|uniref:GGDEF domain-containing protein n=1 Tax=Bathymodiolus platifrons methanotrophic gill symbiont TaxID=113268 RepID=UPI001124E094
VNNRHFLEQRLGEEIARAQRSTEPLSCFFLDIDELKNINDHYGYHVGDQVIILASAVIREQLRNNDVLVRYTGEKFIALLANIEQGQGIEIAQRIRYAVKVLGVSTPDGLVSVTISIGCSTYNPVNGVQLKPANVETNLIEKAEQALHKAKSDGQDSVVSASGFSDPMTLANLFKRHQ